MRKRRATWGEGDSKGETVDTRLTGKFSTGVVEHTVLFGVDWQKADWTGARGAMVNPADIDIFNPVYTDQISAEVQAKVEAGMQAVVNGDIDLTTMFQPQ